MKYTIDTELKTVTIENAYFESISKFADEIKKVEKLFPDYKISIIKEHNLNTYQYPLQGGGIMYTNDNGVPNVTCTSDLIKS